MYGRTYVEIEDIQKLAKPMLRHRLPLSFRGGEIGNVNQFV